jgi:PPOX class probable F420-dependent enzyme
MAATIPNSHMDLLVEPVHGVLTTMMPDGQPQMSVVWVDFDGSHVLLNTTLERQKGKNMQHNPKVNALVIDPSNVTRFIEVRGEVVEITQDGAIGHANKQTQAYSGGTKQLFYGDIYPEETRDKETRVVVKIQPTKVNVNAIFN